ncbi:MAG: hypothetical protein RLZZ210_1384, partial [Pseudomonadota bacterium]
MHHSSAENTNISALKSLLVKYKDNSLTEREKGTYFEK